MKRLPKLVARHGYTLVEVVGVMGALAVIMGASLVTLTALHGADRRFARRMQTQDLVDQLADRLRRDVHGAESAAWDGARGELQLALTTGGVIIYRVMDNRWERRQAVLPSDDSQLDGAFAMPEGAECTVEVIERPRADLVRVAIAPKAEVRNSTRAAPLELEIVAAVGIERELLAP